MYSLYLLPSPYAEPQRANPSEIQKAPRGALQLVRAHHNATAAPLTQAARLRRSEDPHVPLVLWCDLLPPRAALAAAVAASECGLHILMNPVIRSDELRLHVLDPGTLGHKVVRWLEDAGRCVNAPLCAFLEAALGDSRYSRRLELVLDDCGFSYQRMRRALHQCGLGCPSTLHRLLLSVSIAAELQRDSTVPVRDIASRYGCWDDAVLRRHLRDDLGTTASLVRCSIGVEPLLVCGMRRLGLWLKQPLVDSPGLHTVDKVMGRSTSSELSIRQGSPRP
jgi:hypothetical protein